LSNSSDILLLLYLVESLGIEPSSAALQTAAE